MDNDERRKMDRFALELPAFIFIKDENGNQRAFEVTTSNICAGGAFFKIDTPLLPGAYLDIKMLLSHEKLEKMGGQRSRIDVSGSVVRTEAAGVAVCFDKKYRITPL